MNLDYRKIFIFFIVVGGLSLYYFNVISPKRAREHYSVIPTDQYLGDNGPDLNEVQKTFDEAQENDVDERLKYRFQQDMRELNSLENQVKARLRECKAEMGKILGSRDFIDPENVVYEDVVTIYEKAFLAWTETFSRAPAVMALKKLRSILDQDYPIDPIAYRSRLKSYFICWDSKMFNFFETILEVQENNNWSPKQKLGLKNLLLTGIVDALRSNIGMPDSVQLTLTFLGSLRSSGFISEFQASELELLKEEINEFETRFMDQFGVRSQREQNLFLLRDYLARYQTFSEQLLVITEGLKEN